MCYQPTVLPSIVTQKLSAENKINKEKRKVCREFFLATFNISEAFIRCALKKQTSTGILKKDQRGKHTPYNRMLPADEAYLKKHITSFPAVQSHYCRQSSTKRYLDSSLNISIMYHMYKEKRVVDNRKAVSFEKYRMVFNEFNIGFFKPKKDQCKQCLAYSGMNE